VPETEETEKDVSERFSERVRERKKGKRDERESV
jgi:hypothetical protein